MEKITLFFIGKILNVLFFGFYNNYRLAVRVKDKLIDDWNADNFDYLENFQKKDTRYITRAGKSLRVNKSINGVLKNFWTL